MKKVSINLIFLLLSVNIINAQVPFSLSNNTIFTPSGKSIITSGENYYINQPNRNNHSLNIYIKGSALDFDELATYGISVNYPISDQFQLYLGCGYFGFDLMNELNVTSAISLILDNLCLGMSGQYNRVFIKDFSSEGIFSFDLFGKVFSDNFSVGFLVNNINQAQYSNYENTINQRAIFSAGYDISEQFSADVGTVIIINSKSSLLFSAKYRPTEELAINLKYLANNQRITFGLAITPINWIALNFFFTHQEIFGTDYYLINQIDW